MQEEHSNLQEMVSDLETAKDKLQASQKYAETLEKKAVKAEAERDDYQRKFSDSNEWIMSHLLQQVFAWWTYTVRVHAKILW